MRVHYAERNTQKFDNTNGHKHLYSAHFNPVYFLVNSIRNYFQLKLQFIYEVTCMQNKDETHNVTRQ